MEHHVQPALAVTDPEKARALMSKYAPARERLLAASVLSADSHELTEMQAVLAGHLERLRLQA